MPLSFTATLRWPVMSLYCPLCSHDCDVFTCRLCSTSVPSKCSQCRFSATFCFKCKAKLQEPAPVQLNPPENTPKGLAIGSLTKLSNLLAEEEPDQTTVTETLRLLVHQCKNVPSMSGQKQLLADLVNACKSRLLGDGTFLASVTTKIKSLLEEERTPKSPVSKGVAERVRPVHPVVRRPSSIKQKAGATLFVWQSEEAESWSGSLRNTLKSGTGGSTGSLRLLGNKARVGAPKELSRKLSPKEVPESRAIVQKRRPESVMMEFNLKYGGTEPTKKQPLASGPDSVRQLLGVLRAIDLPRDSTLELIAAASRLLADIGDVQTRTSIDLTPPQATVEADIVGNIVSHSISVLEEILRTEHSGVLDAFVYNQLVHSVENLKSQIVLHRSLGKPPAELDSSHHSLKESLSSPSLSTGIPKANVPTESAPSTPTKIDTTLTTSATTAASPEVQPATLSRSRSQRDIARLETAVSPSPESAGVREKVRLFSHRRSKSLGKIKGLVSAHAKVDLFTPPSPPTPGSLAELMWVGDKKQYAARYLPFTGATFSVLYCHDLHEDIGSNMEWWCTLRDSLPCSIFLIEYPGYGGLSKQKATEKGCISAVQAGLAHLLTMTPNVILLGKGLASAFALATAGTYPIILQNPASSIALPDVPPVAGFDCAKKAKFCSGPCYMIVEQLNSEAAALKVLLKPQNYRTLGLRDNPERSASDDYLADLRAFLKHVASKNGLELAEAAPVQKPAMYEPDAFLRSLLKPLGLEGLVVDFLANGYADELALSGITKEELQLVVRDPQQQERIWSTLHPSLVTANLDIPEAVDFSTRLSEAPPPPPPTEKAPEDPIYPGTATPVETVPQVEAAVPSQGEDEKLKIIVNWASQTLAQLQVGFSC